MAKSCVIHIAILPVHKGQYKPVQNGYYGIMIKNLIIASYIVALRTMVYTNTKYYVPFIYNTNIIIYYNVHG